MTLVTNAPVSRFVPAQAPVVYTPSRIDRDVAATGHVHMGAYTTPLMVARAAMAQDCMVVPSNDKPTTRVERLSRASAQANRTYGHEVQTPPASRLSRVA
jgi:hypothetical protein